MTGDILWMHLMDIGAKFGCHQMPERSFTVFGYQFPLCSRCTGLLLGESVAILTPLVRRLPKSFTKSSIMILPTAIDGITQYVGLQESNNKRRFFTGFLAGIGLISLYKNILTREKRK